MHPTGFWSGFYQPLPYCSYSIPQPTVKCNSQNAQNREKIFVQNFRKKTLDKLRGKWYNRKTGARERAPAAKSKRKKIRGNASYSKSSISIPFDFKIRSASLSIPYISAEVAVVLITIAILFPSLSVIIISQIIN